VPPPYARLVRMSPRLTFMEKDRFEPAGLVVEAGMTDAVSASKDAEVSSIGGHA
jgi:hypothetical protein